MNKLRSWSLPLRLAVSGTVLAWLVWRIDWRQVQEALAGLQLGLWWLSVGLLAATQLVSSLRWQMLARPLGFQRTSREFLSAYFVGLFFNMLLPTSVGGDVVRAWRLGNDSGRYLSAFFSVVMDRISGLLILLLFACAAVAFSPCPLPLWLQLAVGSTGGIALLGLLLGLLAARRNNRWAFLQRVLTDVRPYLRQPRLLLTPTLLGIGVQACNVMVVWLIGLALGISIPAAFYWVLVPVTALATLLPISLNGMGIREGVMVLLLAPLDVNAGTAMSLAFLWFLAVAITSLGGLLCYLTDRSPAMSDENQKSPRIAIRGLGVCQESTLTSGPANRSSGPALPAS